MKKISVVFFRNYVSNIIIALTLVVLFSFTYASGVVGVFSSNSYDPYYHGNLNSKNISIMINVYMGTEYIDDILEVILDNNAKATFFVGGSWVVKNEDMLKKIDAFGNEIANHGYLHKDHKNLSLEANQNEIFITHEIVKGLIKKDMTLFAPPSGSFGTTCLKVAYALGYKTIMWTKDTIDWRDQDKNVIYQRAVKNPKGGDFILMHPTKATLEALPSVLSFYTEKGFKLVTVTENLAGM